MGLFDHRHLRNEGPISKILTGIFLIAFYSAGLYRIINVLICDFKLGLVLILGPLFLFFLPFFIFGGYEQIREGVSELKSRHKEDDK